ncbi:hypothetical protein ACFY5D_03710 [Paeniglutamicibacter sp. NPDC012692]|uniref:hypothetical protein n=1 Tax=Paeniglutamicibacter sp. NPDC012692 TaxID=3364388 RepID=UPI0036A76770
MARPRWAHLISQARTARAWRWPITVLLGYRAQDGMVNQRDRFMAIALQAYEDSLCSGCGLPHSMTRGDANVGRFEVQDDVTCHGCEANESYVADKNRTTYPGQKVYLVDTHE